MKMYYVLAMLLVGVIFSWCSNQEKPKEICNWIEFRWYCENTVIDLCDSLISKNSRRFERNEEQMKLFNECTKEYLYLFEKLD